MPTDTPIVAWETGAGSGLRATPVLTERTVVVASSDRKIRVLDRQDGTEYWNRGTGARPGAPVVVGDRIYVGTEAPGEGEVRSLRFRDGGTVWRRRVGSLASPIAFDDGQIYGVTDAGIAFALRAGDGREIWKSRLPGRGRPWGPVVHGERVLVLSGADTLYSLDRRTGRPLGQAPLPGHAVGRPALVGDTLVVSTGRGSLVAYTANGPRRLWETGGFDLFAGGPVLAEGEALAVTRLGAVVAFRLADGRHRVLAQLREIASAGPTLVEGGLLVGTLSGRLYLLDSEGQAIWTKALEGSITHPPAALDGQIAVPMYGPMGGFLGSRPLRGKVVMLR